MTTAEALNYYARQLIIQYAKLPKAEATIKCLVNNAVCDGLPFAFQEAFNLETASGQQLTILGKIVGISRNIYGLDLNREFFNFTRYTGMPASIGFARFGSPNNQYFLSRWLSAETYTASDFELRALIKIKIIANNYYTSLKTIKEALYAIFQDDIELVDNLDCTITYNLKDPYHNVGTICNFLGNILPKPMGVGIDINNV